MDENKGEQLWSMKEKLKDQLFLFVEVDFIVCKLNGISRDEQARGRWKRNKKNEWTYKLHAPNNNPLVQKQKSKRHIKITKNHGGIMGNWNINVKLQSYMNVQ